MGTQKNRLIDGSFEHPKFVFKLMGKKIISIYTHKFGSITEPEPKLKNMFVSPYLPTKMPPNPYNFIIIFSYHIFFSLGSKIKDVKVLSHVCSGARSEEYCATIYQITP